MTRAVVYRIFGAGDVLLYVGTTDDLNRRMKEHRRRSVWWPWAVRSVITRFETRQAAEEAEAEAIISEHPLFNVKVPRSALSKAA